MYSQYLVLLFCLLLASPTIQGTKTMKFKAINGAEGAIKGTKRTKGAKGTRGSPAYMLGSSKITQRYAEVSMKTAYDLILKEIYKRGDPFGKEEIKQITLEVDTKQGSEFVASKNRILVPENYLNNKGDDKTFKKDFNRRIHHAMTLVFLLAGDSKISEELQKGIADFIVLEADLAPDNWAKPGEGTSWSERSDVTAQFLHYCDMTSRDFVSKLVNDYESYEKNLDKDLEYWWKQYQDSYKKA